MTRNDIVKTINSLEGEAGHKKVLEVYNAQKNLPRGYKVQPSDPWCATTVSAVFLMNGYPDIAECSCPQMIEKAKAKGIWVEDDSFVPQIGDIIMYDWQDSGKGDDIGVPDHTGIVISVTKNRIVVREGNKNKSIGNRDVLVNGINIRGYITPVFDDKQTSPKTTTPTTPTTSTSTTKTTIKMPTIKRGSTGKAVKIWQIIVGATVDGIFGPSTEARTLSFQDSHNLTPDKIVGDITWATALNSLK